MAKPHHTPPRFAERRRGEGGWSRTLRVSPAVITATIASTRRRARCSIPSVHACDPSPARAPAPPPPPCPCNNSAASGPPPTRDSTTSRSSQFFFDLGYRQESDVLEDQNTSFRTEIQRLESEKRRLMDVLAMHSPNCLKTGSYFLCKFSLFFFFCCLAAISIGSSTSVPIAHCSLVNT